MSTADAILGAEEYAKGYFMGSLSEKSFRKRETAAEEDASRDEIKNINWHLSVKGRQKNKPRKPSPKTSRSIADERRTYY